MIHFDMRTNVRELIAGYGKHFDDVRGAVRKGVRSARPGTDAILNAEVDAAFRVRDQRMRRSWRLAVPGSGEIKLIVSNLMRGFGLHVRGGTISPKHGTRLLVPINTRGGTRIGTKKFYRMIDWLRREKLTVIIGNILYVRVPTNQSRRGGVAVGSRVQKRFRSRFQGSKKRPSGFEINLNAEGLTPIAVLRPSVTLRARFDNTRIVLTRIMPLINQGIAAEMARVR